MMRSNFINVTFNKKLQVLPCVIRNAIIHDDASVIRGKKKQKRISELFVSGCYCEQTISNVKKSAKPSPYSIRRLDRSLSRYIKKY